MNARELFYFCIIIIAILIVAFLIYYFVTNKTEPYVNFDINSVKKYLAKPMFKDNKYKIVILYVNNSKNISKNSRKILNILKQSVRVNMILFALPLAEETSKGFEKIPKWITMLGPTIPEIKSKSGRWKDTGVLTHAHISKSGNTIGIVLNDKFDYELNYIEKLLNYYENNNGYIINDKNKSLLFKPEFFVESELVKSIVLPKNKMLKFSP